MKIIACVMNTCGTSLLSRTNRRHLEASYSFFEKMSTSGALLNKTKFNSGPIRGFTESTCGQWSGVVQQVPKL